MITCWLYIPIIFLISIPATLKLYVLFDDSPDKISVVPVPLVLVVISSVVLLRALMMYWVIQCCDGGDQVILTELSFSITIDNSIGEPSTV